MKRLVTLAAVITLTFWVPQRGLAESADDLKALRQELETLKAGQTAIQKELQEIKQLLRARPAAAPAEPQNVVLSVADAPSKGDKQAKLTLIEFTDYQ